VTGAFASRQGFDLANGLRLRADIAGGQVVVAVVQPEPRLGRRCLRRLPPPPCRGT
jgi:hypothetical protein